MCVGCSIDRLEKAERNMLPLLNNLLENREMRLDDGRMLVHPRTYAHLLTHFSSDRLHHELKIFPVHSNFRVVALGLPVCHVHMQQQ
jgi:von Willebrand factor A domain-containing protein 8